MNGRCYMHGGPCTTMMHLQRAAEVASLRARGFTIQEIARRVGVSKGTVNNDLCRAHGIWMRRRLDHQPE